MPTTAAPGKEPANEAQAHNPLDDLKAKLPNFHFNPTGLADGITSHLGRYNPFAHPLDGEDAVAWLFDNTAYAADPSHPTLWQTELIAAYFQRRSGDEESQVVAQLASAIGLADNAEAKKTIAKRLEPLLNEILPAKTAKVCIDGRTEMALWPSGPDGIARQKVTLPLPEGAGNWKDNDTLQTTLIGGPDYLPSTTYIASQEGWGIISDIDDTIKMTLTNSPLGILKTTFAEQPRVIDGMPGLYAHMAQKLDKPSWWYLSASPYNLYPFLRGFLHEHYPKGTLLLKDASWMNLSGFIMSLGTNTQTYKVENLQTVNSNWPKRKMVCIGDSTQSDPEAYGEMYRKDPGWIKAIFIRRVPDVVEIKDVLPGQSSEERNKPERFEKAFEQVPRSVWYVFDEPKELFEKVDKLVKAAS